MNAQSKDELLGWLRESRPARLRELYGRADRVRRERVGDAVHLRGLIEISSHIFAKKDEDGEPLVNKIEKSNDIKFPLFLKGNPPVGTCTICVGKKEIGWKQHFGVVRPLNSDIFYQGE